MPGEQEPTKERGGWVDAQERLPEEGVTVLVDLDYGPMAFGRRMDGEWEVETAPWDGFDVEEEEYDVQHWMEVRRPARE